MHKYCTIVSSNYLPQAFTLADSISEIYPGEHLEILIIDLEKNAIKNFGNINFLYTEDFDIPVSIISKMRSYYDVVEFATALKPTLLLHLLANNANTVSYIDPDVYLYGKLDDAQEIARKVGIAVTPHRITPMPLEKTSPKELSFMRVGIYNLGFVCVGTTSVEILQWWEQRLRWFATQFDQLPYFTDQKWADFFPTFACCEILRHPGYNVAFWNIDERQIRRQQSSYTVKNQSLVFIHFSQMSTELMLKKETKLWGSWLSSELYDSESLSIVKIESECYGDKLQRNRNLANGLRLSPNYEFSSQSKFGNYKMIQRDIRGKAVTFGPIRKLFRFTNRLELMSERSSALNGWRVGLQKDIAKLKDRLKH